MIDEFFTAVDADMRRVLRTVVKPLVPMAHVDSLVDLLRAWTSGVVLVSIEHPEIWTPAKQLAILDDFLARLQLRP